MTGIADNAVVDDAVVGNASSVTRRR